MTGHAVETATHRRTRFRTVVGAVVLCGLFSVVAFIARAENGEIEVTPQPVQLHAAPLDLGPGPLPPRRGLPPKAQVAVAHATDQAIEQCVEADMRAVGAPGAAVTVMLDGQVIFDRGFGYKRRGHPELVDSNTRFRIGSITKTLTAAAVMQQVEAGLVDLDAPVTDWIPELSLSGRWPADTITVRHLLTHSAAIPDYYVDPLGPTGDEALGEWAGTLGHVQLHAPRALSGITAIRASPSPVLWQSAPAGSPTASSWTRGSSIPPG